MSQQPEIDGARRGALARERALRRMLEEVHSAALALCSAADLPDTLRTLADRARDLVGADFAAVGLTSEGGAPPFETWTWSGLTDEQAAALGAAPQPTGLLAALCANPEPVRAPDAARDPAHAPLLGAGAPPIGAFIGLPIERRGRALAYLFVAHGRPGAELTEIDHRGLDLLIEHAAIALEHGLLRRRMERTQRERERSAETALRRGETLLRQVLDSLPVGVWVTDAEGKIILGNAAGQRVWAGARYVGIEQYGEYKGWWVETGRPIAAEEWALARAVRNGETSLNELVEIQCFDATHKIILNSAAPVKDAEGRILGAIVVNEDVTERRRVEKEREQLLEALSDERRWLHAVIDRSPIGILRYERKPAGRLVANRRAEALLGAPMPAGDDLAALRDRLFQPDGAPLPAEALSLDPILRGETVTGRELLVRRPDGGEVAVQTNASPIWSEHGEVLGAVVTFEDITPLKDLERLREEWTSVVAHDLRQPLTVIMTTAALLARKLEAPDVRGKAERILTTAGRLNRMIGDLLDVSQLEARRLRLAPERTALPALLASVIDQVAQGADRERISLSVAGSIPDVPADPHRVQQIVENLLTNALKYGAPDTPIEVTVERRDPDVVVAVRNRGPGIAEEDLPLLFERFQRGRERDGKIKGLGLGLYICRGLVEAHRGRIAVESIRDQSTTFTFTLPLAAPEPAAAD